MYNMKYLTAVLIALGLMVGGSQEVSAFHSDKSHTTIICSDLDVILNVAHILLSRDTSRFDVEGKCQSFKIEYILKDAPFMSALSSPMKDFEGDWYAPFEVSLADGTYRYVIVYAPKGEKEITPTKIGREV